MEPSLFTQIRATAKTFVPPDGLSIADIIVCGEQPGKTEVMLRKPFVGQSGKLLKACLQGAQIPTSQCYFTNVLKDFDETLEEYCKPPSSSKGSPQWIGRGREYVELLREEINSHDANLIIAVGNVALAALTGRWGITRWRGSLIPCFFNEQKYVVPIIHPASVLRGASEGRHLILVDLKKARSYKENGFQLKERIREVGPSFVRTMEFLDDCYEKGISGHTIAFDIEIKNLELNCFSLSYSPEHGISIPFYYSGGDYFTVSQEVAIMKSLARILSSRQIRKVGQNLAFDTHFMLRKYGIRSSMLDDTMIAHHTLLPQLPKGLDMICSLFTDIPYYKDEGKEWFKGAHSSYERLWTYNVNDSLVCIEAMPLIYKDLSQMGNIQAYERQLSMLEPCVYMMERGIKVDIHKMEAARLNMQSIVRAKREELEELVPGLNLNSPKQVKEYFYTKLGLPPYHNKSGKESADADALKRIAKKHGKPGSVEAKKILEIRKQEKLISTYLESRKYDTDGRIRCSYNPAGTTYSRLSSSESIFGTGMNMQNWPHHLLKFLVADEGYVIYSMDLSQAENRIVAYVGRIERMIQAFENNEDVHSLTAGLVFGKKPEEISDEPGSSLLGSGEYSERFWGKKANHGLNYDLGFKSFAKYYDLPDNESKFIVESYHKAYPELRKNFHGYVKDCLRKNRMLENLMGRKTLFLTDLDDSTFKAAYSCIPQGTVGDVVDERGLAFIYYNKLFEKVELLQQVHDSISFQIPLSLPWEEHAFLLDSIKKNLETPLTTHYGREFVIPVDTVMGLNLMKEDGYELKAKRWPATIEELATKLEEAYSILEEKKRCA